MNKYCIILAAGKGSRMKSRDPNVSKVAYPILGKPLVDYVLDAVEPLDINEKIVVVGFGGETTKSIVENRATVVWQHEQLGTGHAVLQAKPNLENKEGCTLILCGDAPLLTSDTIANIYKKHEKENHALTIATSFVENPKGYGRIIREKKSNKVLAIREDKDCNEEESEINEINAGLYLLDNKLLFQYLDKVTPTNKQNEYYLTDIIDLFVKDGLKVGTYVVENPEEIFGINDRAQLAYAAKVIHKRINHKLMQEGVSIEDPTNTYISADAIIGRDTVIRPNTHILGKCVIGEGNFIGPNSYLENCNVGNDNNILSSWLTDTTVGNNNAIGPYTKTRNGTVIGSNCRVGNFVELNDAHFGDGVKSAHLSYIGNAELGARTNVGCGTITANYDGFSKMRTHVGEDVFIGSGSILIAPVTLEDKTFTAAGSTITHNVTTDTMAIARARQVDLEHGYSIFRAKAKAKKEAATQGKK